MAIDFPNAPVNGSTYDYLGIRYTFTKNGADEGYWRVTTPGNSGIATSAEINTGTNAVKYVTPQSLVGSDEWLAINTKTLATDLVIAEGSNWAGIAYTDPDALGSTPTAKIYPDGTIVGSTSYGEYIKHPNGELECRGNGTINITSASNGQVVMLYPVAFIGSHHCNATKVDDGLPTYAITKAIKTDTSIVVSVWNMYETTLATGTTIVDYISKGKWK